MGMQRGNSGELSRRFKMSATDRPFVRRTDSVRNLTYFGRARVAHLQRTVDPIFTVG